MTARLETHIGSLRLKNPVIAGPAEHLIDPDNVRRALRTDGNHSAAGCSVDRFAPHNILKLTFHFQWSSLFQNSKQSFE